MKIVRCSWFPPKGYKAMTVLKWIIVRGNLTMSSRDINHEGIHYEQEKELLFVFFYLLYGLEFVLKFLFRYWNWHKAYRNLSFEREAYTNEGDMSYTQERHHYAWLRYM